jgi:hypothetical protein
MTRPLHRATCRPLPCPVQVVQSERSKATTRRGCGRSAKGQRADSDPGRCERGDGTGLEMWLKDVEMPEDDVNQVRRPELHDLADEE